MNEPINESIPDAHGDREFKMRRGGEGWPPVTLLAPVTCSNALPQCSFHTAHTTDVTGSRANSAVKRSQLKSHHCHFIAQP